MLLPPEISTSWVRLRLLQKADIDALLTAASNPDVWTWFIVDLSVRENMEKWIDTVLKRFEAGTMIPLVIEDRKEGRLVGSSSFMNIAESDLCLEIGTTWIDKNYHGSGINYHMKFVMLKHAFEVWQFERVEFRTDALNVRSRKAIEKIGAVYEALFRNHRFNKDGGRRDSVIYRILKEDWPTIRDTVFGDLEKTYDYLHSQRFIRKLYKILLLLY